MTISKAEYIGDFKPEILDDREAINSIPNFLGEKARGIAEELISDYINTMNKYGVKSGPIAFRVNVEVGYAENFEKDEY